MRVAIPAVGAVAAAAGDMDGVDDLLTTLGMCAVPLPGPLGDCPIGREGSRMEFAVGVTVGLRVERATSHDYCKPTIEGVRKAGFTEDLHLFLEPGAERHVPSVPGLVLHDNPTQLGCFQNFARSLWWLVERIPTADWYFMMQDDCLWKPDSYALMRTTCADPQYADVGFLSPYTSKAMIPFGTDRRGKPLASTAPLGWIQHKFHNKAFWGAVCMVFPRQAARDLLAFPRFREHTHTRKLDVVLGNCTRDMGKAGLVHVPSLCDHIGNFSTLGRHKIKGNRWARRGWGFKG